MRKLNAPGMTLAAVLTIALVGGAAGGALVLADGGDDQASGPAVVDVRSVAEDATAAPSSPAATPAPTSSAVEDAAGPAPVPRPVDEEPRSAATPESAPEPEGDAPAKRRPAPAPAEDDEPVQDKPAPTPAPTPIPPTAPESGQPCSPLQEGQDRVDTKVDGPGLKYDYVTCDGGKWRERPGKKGEECGGQGSGDLVCKDGRLQSPPADPAVAPAA